MESREGNSSLTRRQRETLAYLHEFVATHHYPPTVRQVCLGLGLSSTQTAYAHLCKLEQKGYIRLSRAHRTIQLLADEHLTTDASLRGQPANLVVLGERSHKSIPLVGRVAAGLPLLAAENVEGYVDLRGLGGADEVFALRVKGDSMMDAGILDGDYILVRRQETAENGDIVVALLRDEATVKYFFREEKRIRLQPANSRMRPIRVKEVNLVGKVIASLRGYGPVTLIR